MGKTNATFISYPLYNERVQLMRALAIICVVMIHTSPGGIDQVFIRPFINLCVALFIFLSGYLTQFGHEKIGEIYRKRVSRVLIPYLIWTCCIHIRLSWISLEIILEYTIRKCCRTDVFYTGVYSICPIDAIYSHVDSA